MGFRTVRTRVTLAALASAAICVLNACTSSAAGTSDVPSPRPDSPRADAAEAHSPGTEEAPANSDAIQVSGTSAEQPPTQQADAPSNPPSEASGDLPPALADLLAGKNVTVYHDDTVTWAHTFCTAFQDMQDAATPNVDDATTAVDTLALSTADTYHQMALAATAAAEQLRAVSPPDTPHGTEFAADIDTWLTTAAPYYQAGTDTLRASDSDIVTSRDVQVIAASVEGSVEKATGGSLTAIIAAADPDVITTMSTLPECAMLF